MNEYLPQHHVQLKETRYRNRLRLYRSLMLHSLLLTAAAVVTIEPAVGQARAGALVMEPLPDGDWFRVLDWSIYCPQNASSRYYFCNGEGGPEKAPTLSLEFSEYGTVSFRLMHEQPCGEIGEYLRGKVTSANTFKAAVRKKFSEVQRVGRARCRVRPVSESTLNNGLKIIKLLKSLGRSYEEQQLPDAREQSRAAGQSHKLRDCTDVDPNLIENCVPK